MNVKEYLEWFAENLCLMNKFYDGHLEFITTFHSGVWRVGYAYIEDYDGFYHVESMCGKSDKLDDALEKSYDNTLPTLIRLDNIQKKFNNPPWGYSKGAKYTIICVSRGGEICKIPIMALGAEKRGGELFKDMNTERHLLYLRYQSGLIFPFIPQEILKEL